MKNVTVETRLTINLTADQWQLYNKPGRDLAAAEINGGIMRRIHAVESLQEAYKQCAGVLAKYDHFGATDSEPLSVLERLLQLRFPGKGWQ